MAAILITGSDQALVETASMYVKQYADRVNRRKVRVLGPTSPRVEKISDVYRKVIYIRHASYDVLIDMKNKIEQYIELNSGFRTLRVQFDFDPMQLF